MQRRYKAAGKFEPSSLKYAEAELLRSHLAAGGTVVDAGLVVALARWPSTTIDMLSLRGTAIVPSGAITIWLFESCVSRCLAFEFTTTNTVSSPRSANSPMITWLRFTPYRHRERGLLYEDFALHSNLQIVRTQAESATDESGSVRR